MGDSVKGLHLDSARFRTEEGVVRSIRCGTAISFKFLPTAFGVWVGRVFESGIDAELVGSEKYPGK